MTTDPQELPQPDPNTAGTTKQEEPMSASDWLAKLKIGDRVLIEFGYERPNPNYGPAKIADVKGRSVYIGLGSGSSYRFRMSDGKHVGVSDWRLLKYDAKVLRRQASQRLEQEKRRELFRKLDKVQWRELPLKTLRAIAALLPAEARATKGTP